MHNVDVKFFPGWTRQSFTFTDDDGNLPLDKKFMDIMRPNGINGTFNLCGTDKNRLSPEGYREFYRGFEIANHCKFHPFALTPERDRPIGDGAFDEKTADPGKNYPVSGVPGLYWFRTESGWRRLAPREDYLRFVRQGKEELEEAFGEGSVVSFVWPYCMQDDPELFAAIRAMGYKNIRKTGNLEDKTGFSLPADRTQWSYNVNHIRLHEVGDLYRAYPDDGELKFFCFGLHSHDYENNGLWEMLRQFAEDFGNRPEEFWYATVGEIFDYEDAVRALKVGEAAIANDSDLTLYAKIDGKRVTLAPHSVYRLEN